MTTLYLIVPGRPVPKPRMTQRDKWQLRPSVEAYRDYVDQVRAAAIDAKRAAGMGDFDLLRSPARVQISFEAERTHVVVSQDVGRAHRPSGLTADVDNLAKAILEGLQPQRGVAGSSLLLDDRQVVALEAAFGSWPLGRRPSTT